MMQNQNYPRKARRGKPFNPNNNQQRFFGGPGNRQGGGNNMNSEQGFYNYPNFQSQRPSIWRNMGDDSDIDMSGPNYPQDGGEWNTDQQFNNRYPDQWIDGNFSQDSDNYPPNFPPNPRMNKSFNNGKFSPAPRKRKFNEYIFKAPACTDAIQSKNLKSTPEVSVNVDGKKSKISKNDVDALVKCGTCALYFSNEEALASHKASDRHNQSLKLAMKAHLTSAFALCKELTSQHNPKETQIPTECQLCCSTSSDAKLHKWSFKHQVNILINENKKESAESNMQTDDDGDITDYPGSKFIINISGLYCRICRKKVTSKSVHCSSKKHVGHVKRIEHADAMRKEKAELKEKEKEAEGSEEKPDITDDQKPDITDDQKPEVTDDQKPEIADDQIIEDQEVL